MLNDNDMLLDDAILGNLEWQIKKIENEINNKLNLIEELEKKRDVIKGFVGEITLEVLFSLAAAVLVIRILPVLNLFSLLYFELLDFIMAFSLSLVVWFRIKKDYCIYRDNDYNDLVNEIRKNKAAISNLRTKKIELVEMRNLVKKHLMENANRCLQCSIKPIVHYDDVKSCSKIRILYK